MVHRASVDFWADYENLPFAIRQRADKQFALLKIYPQHPSLHLKKIGDRNGREIWSARITLKHWALAVRSDAGFLWFWVGDHATYDALV